MLTCALPPNTALSLSSALIMRRFFLSWSPFFLMYAQIFFVSSVRGIGDIPTTAPTTASGCTGFMNAAFGLRFAFFAFFAAGVLGFLFVVVVCFFFSFCCGPRGDLLRRGG